MRTVESTVTRISRISTPRATLGAIALLVIVMAGFGLFADGGENPPTHSARVAKEAIERPATEISQHCRAETGIPLATMESNRDVHL